MTDAISDSPTSTPNPSFTVLSDQVGALGVPEGCQLGEEYDAKLKVTSVSDGEGGRSVGFEVVSVAGGGAAPGEIGAETLEEPAPEAETEEDAAEEEMLGYKRPKGTRDTPKMDAKDLEF